MATEFIWQSADRTTAIHLSLDVVDGILNECMRGLGAVPRRGAEVGGVLLGSVTHEGSERQILVKNFESVPIEYRHGPSYAFSQADAQLFASTIARLYRGANAHPVGFFRSNTREEMELSAEDVQILREHFADPDAIALLIRPFTTRPSMAGFVLPQDGQFAIGTAPPDEFLFRRRELEEILDSSSTSAGPRVPYRPFAMPAPQPVSEPEPVAVPMGTVSTALQAAASRSTPAPPASVRPTPVGRKKRVWWSMIPLSSIFLAVGILLGIQATLTLRGVPSDPYDLKLTLSKSANNLTLSWDRAAPAIRAAQRGTVSIEDGTVKITRDLEAAELRSGSIVYMPTTTSVHFRLQVFPKQRDSITETIDWSQ